jgi:branched-chain amino acid transport system permease protein
VPSSGPSPSTSSRLVPLTRRLPSALTSGSPLRNWTFAIVVLAIAAIIPAFKSGYFLFQLELVFLYIAAGTGLNVAVGYAGEILLSQATVLGVAAYAAGILSIKYNWAPVATIVPAILAGVIWQLFISIAGLRVRGLYLGLLSFFSVLVFPDLIDLTHGVTGGTLGLIGIPPFFLPGTSGSTIVPYLLTLGIAAISALVVRNLVVSGWGIRLRYLRDAPNALPTVGLNIATTKLTAYVVAAIPAGLAGWAFAYLSESLTSDAFSVTLSIIIFAGVQLAGPGTVIGPIIGVGLLEGYSQLIGPFSQYNVMGLGVLLVAVLIFFPKGIARVRLQATERRNESPATDSAGTLSGSGPGGAPPGAPESAGSPASDSAETVASPAAASPPAAHDGPVALEVDGIVKTFGGLRAVNEAAFSVPAGRVVALMGDNGSGKTTLVNIISGFIRPDSGEVRIGGRTATGLGATAVANLGCCRTFQVPQLVAELTARENVEAGLLRANCAKSPISILLPRVARRADRKRRQEATAVCLELGLSPEQIETQVDILPLGLRRIVEVARAIASEAKVVCLDEPAAGLNDEELVELSTAMRKLAAAGRAVLVVEHNGRFVLDTCDDIVLLRQGQVEGDFRDVDRNALPPLLQKHLRQEAVA